ncbi:MAG: hypothetical protein WCQ32_02455 [bacterium]
MSLEKEVATGAQYAQFGLLIAQSVVEKMGQRGFSKKQMQQLLTGPGKGRAKEIASAVVDETTHILITVWDRQQEKLSIFWKKYFNHDIDWSKLTLPEEKEGFNILEYIPNCFTEDDIYNKYVEIFGKDSVSEYYHIIHDCIKTQQTRITDNRLILHRGGQGPDAEHLGKSYNVFSKEPLHFMTPIEGIISALRYRVETGEVIRSFIGFHALNIWDDAMGMCRNVDGRFRIYRNFRDRQDSYYGPCEVVL